MNSGMSSDLCTGGETSLQYSVPVLPCPFDAGADAQEAHKLANFFNSVHLFRVV